MKCSQRAWSQFSSNADSSIQFRRWAHLNSCMGLFSDTHKKKTLFDILPCRKWISICFTSASEGGGTYPFVERSEKLHVRLKSFCGPLKSFVVWKKKGMLWMRKAGGEMTAGEQERPMHPHFPIHQKVIMWKIVSGKMLPQAHVCKAAITIQLKVTAEASSISSSRNGIFNKGWGAVIYEKITFLLMHYSGKAL